MKKTNRLILSLSSIVLTSFLTQQIVLADDLNGEIETITSIEDYKLKEEENKRNEKLEDTEVTNKNITTLTDNDAESIKKVNQQNSDSDTGKYESKDNITEFKSSDLKIADDQDSSIRTISESYEAVIIFGQYSIDTKPWGEEGYKNIGTTDTYVNKNVSIIDESSEGHYKLAEFDGKKLGWIDHRAFGRIDATTVARIGKGSYSVDTQPWGMEGYKKINETDRLLGKEVKVVSQKQNKEYSYVLVDDKPYGWVDNRALISKEEPYDSWIINPNFSIDNAPWGERNFKKRDTSNRYVNERIKVLGVNQTKTYYLIADQQGKTLGWIDHRALSNANYTAQIIRGDNFSIDTRPWGTPGYKRIG
ncbi:SH3-like domain-containing protein, partial [Atopobacter phocae]|uniref:SH3-like domain-containing protein n=1 Tax=Atopobacter phocae TaxID=136492 RepID=UPI0005583A33